MRFQLSGLPILLLAASTLAAQPQPADPVEPESEQVSASPPEREVSLKTFGPNLLRDQARIWTFPAKVVTGHHSVPTAAVLGVTGGLIAADPTTGRFFRRREDTFVGLNERLTESASTTGSLLTPAVFYLTGLVRKDRYMQSTGLLAAEAWVGAEVPNVVLRASFRRLRPLDFDPASGSFRHTWFNAEGNPLAAKGGFPSGHTATAFAVATVVARRYSHHRWVPWVAYGLASTVAFSRATSGNHFLSDIFFGGAIGYSVGRFVVLRQ
jgi:membrane-associated phospholipid phosphatase